MQIASFASLRTERFYSFLYFFMANTTPTSSAKPVVTIRYGLLSVAAFANEAKSKDGETFETYSVSIRRSYKKGEKWEHTHSLRRSDLLRAAEALTQCFRYLAGDREGVQVDTDSSES